MEGQLEDLIQKFLPVFHHFLTSMIDYQRIPFSTMINITHRIIKNG